MSDFERGDHGYNCLWGCISIEVYEPEDGTFTAYDPSDDSDVVGEAGTPALAVADYSTQVHAQYEGGQ